MGVGEPALGVSADCGKNNANFRQTNWDSNDQSDVTGEKTSRHFGDLDGDGDIDLLVKRVTAELNPSGAGNYYRDVFVAWNDGRGMLDINASGTRDYQALSTNRFGNTLLANVAYPDALGDLDNDGDLDIILASKEPFMDRIEVWENDGSGTFSSNDMLAAFELSGTHTFATGNLLLKTASYADVDGDGRMDIFARYDLNGNSRSGTQALKNGAGYPLQGYRTTILKATSGLSFAYASDAIDPSCTYCDLLVETIADWDGDGKLRAAYTRTAATCGGAAGTCTCMLCMYSCTCALGMAATCIRSSHPSRPSAPQGTSTSWPSNETLRLRCALAPSLGPRPPATAPAVPAMTVRWIVVRRAQTFFSPFASIGIATDGEVVHMYRNDGEGNFVKDASTVFTSTDLAGLFKFLPHEILDIDGDGDLDLWFKWLAAPGAYAAHTYADRAMYYASYGGLLINDGNGLFSVPLLPSSETELGTQPPDVVRAGDYDGDGDLDAVLSVEGSMGSNVVMMRNDGKGNMVSVANFFDAANANTFEIDMADVDGDGFLDLAMSPAFVERATLEIQQTVRESRLHAGPLPCTNYATHRRYES